MLPLVPCKKINKFLIKPNQRRAYSHCTESFLCEVWPDKQFTWTGMQPLSWISFSEFWFGIQVTWTGIQLRTWKWSTWSQARNLSLQQFAGIIHVYFRSRRWGSRHAGPSSQPAIHVSGNFVAHVSAESPSNISPSPSEVISKVFRSK